MPIRVQHIHKHHQPGDLASFARAETERMVRAGLGTIEDPADDFERGLLELQNNLPTVPIPGRVAELSGQPPSVDPSLVTPGAPVDPKAPVSLQAPRGSVPASTVVAVSKEIAPAAREPVRPTVPPQRDRA